jgi:tetratricopeptide (TPR) repeat protein
LASCKKEGLAGGAGKELPVSYWQALIAQASGDRTKAAEAFTRARATMAAQLATQPDDPISLATLGLIDAGLGRKEEALREGRRAVELRPLTEDAVDGATVLLSLATIHAWLGDAKSALDQLEFLARSPNGLSFGQLKYDPAWDALRGDPRFEPILKQLQPRAKETR